MTHNIDRGCPQAHAPSGGTEGVTRSGEGAPRRAGLASQTGSVLALLLLLTALISGCGLGTLTDEQHFERAVQAQEGGDIRTALIELKNALQKNPEHSEARMRLGLLSLELGDVATARTELRRVAQERRNHPAVVTPLAQALVLDGEYDAALEALDAIAAEHLGDKEAASVQVVRGDALAGMGRVADAHQAYEAALAADPQKALAHVGKARLAMRGERLDEARSSLAQALDADGRSHQAWALLGDIEGAEGQLEAAVVAYTEALQGNLNPFDLHLRRGVTQFTLRNHAGAQEDLEALRRIAPQHPGTSYLEGLLHLGAGRYVEAQSAFERSLSVAPGFPAAMFHLGASHLALGQWNRAEQHLLQFLRIQPESTDAARLLAAVRMRQGDLQRGEELLTQVLERAPDSVPALMLMGALQLEKGQYGAGIERFQRTVAMQPDDPTLRAALADALRSAGETEEALRHLDLAVEKSPEDLALEATLILRLIEGGQYANALERARLLREREPDSALPLNLMAFALIGQGDVVEARSALREALAIEPGDPAASANLGQLATLDNDFDEARRIYRESLQQNPGHLDISLRFAQLEFRAGNTEAMRRLLEDAVRQNPDAVRPRVVLGRHHMGKMEPRRVLALLEPVLGATQGDREVLDLLAQAQIAAGLNTQAVATLRRLTDLAPDIAESRYRLGQGFEEAGSHRDARVQYRRATELDPSHHGALLRLAELELREGRRPEARQIARQMQSQRPEVAAAGYSIEARVHAEEGRSREALAALTRAHELGPSADTAVQLALAHQRAGDLERAVQILEERISEFPDEVSVRFQLGIALHNKGDYRAAIRQYEDLVISIPDNVVVLNNLAFLYQAEGDPRALEIAERAYAVRPDSASVSSTLGWILVNRGEVERGLPLLATARASLPDRPDVRFRYAAGLAEAGRDAEAMEELKALLDQVEAFPQRAEAERLLQSLR